MRRLSGCAVVMGMVLVHCDPALAAGGRSLRFPHEAVDAGRWSLVIAVGALLVGLPLALWLIGALLRVERSVRGRPASRGRGRGSNATRFSGIMRGALTGADGRLSTSKTVAVVWTYTLASALLSIVIAKWMGHGHAYGEQVKHGLQSEYALLIGGPLGAAIAAKGIVSNQVEVGGASRPATSTAQATDLITNDSGNTDLGDLQYVLFNVVALIFFYGELWTSPQRGLPTIPDVLLGLTSVSAVGYVAKKALPTTGLSIVKVDPTTGPAGTPVTLYVSGLVNQQGPAPTPADVTVTFGRSLATVQMVGTTAEGPTATALVPSGVANGIASITVSYQGTSFTRADAFTIT